MTKKSPVPADHTAVAVSIWKEALFGADLLLLHTSPVFYGWGVPRGDGSAVVLIPGFLGTDVHVTHLHAWLRRIGYRPYLSGIGLNAGCPNLLVRDRLTATVNRARAETGGKVHLIGHSLGGIMARSVAGRRPWDIASVITLGSPFRGTLGAHRSVLREADSIRRETLREHGSRVLADCSTSRCGCAFVNSLKRKMSPTVARTAIYTRDDGVVDWRTCRTGDAASDFEVPGTHVGLVFNPSVYAIIAARLAGTGK
jgi:pimeloyl-ACP methyl ester carboxylesterase